MKPKRKTIPLGVKAEAIWANNEGLRQIIDQQRAELVAYREREIRHNNQHYWLMEELKSLEKLVDKITRDCQNDSNETIYARVFRLAKFYRENAEMA